MGTSKEHFGKCKKLKLPRKSKKEFKKKIVSTFQISSDINTPKHVQRALRKTSRWNMSRLLLHNYYINLFAKCDASAKNIYFQEPILNKSFSNIDGKEIRIDT